MIYTLLEPTHPLLHTKLPKFIEDIDRKEFTEGLLISLLGKQQSKGKTL